MMMGLYANEQCTYCNKKGRNENSCWETHPEAKPSKGKPCKNKQTLKCFKCCKVGHIKKECPHSMETMEALASLNNNNKETAIDCYMTTYMDSACQCHTVKSLRLLHAGTIQRTITKLKGVGGTVTLTHMGQRTILTIQIRKPRQSLSYSNKCVNTVNTRKYTIIYGNWEDKPYRGWKEARVPAWL